MMATTTLTVLAVVVVRPLGNNAFLMLMSASTLQEAEEDDGDRYREIGRAHV